MAYVVTERCVNCRYTDCVTVCPVNCFWEVADPAMLVIDPDTCIHCGLCVPACPIAAIYPEESTPEPYKPWIEKNRELFAGGTNVTAKLEPLPTAIPLEAIQEREKQNGWDIAEPAAE